MLSASDLSREAEERPTNLADIDLVLEADLQLMRASGISPMTPEFRVSSFMIYSKENRLTGSVKNDPVKKNFSSI